MTPIDTENLGQGEGRTEKATDTPLGVLGEPTQCPKRTLEMRTPNSHAMKCQLIVRQKQTELWKFAGKKTVTAGHSRRLYATHSLPDPSILAVSLMSLLQFCWVHSVLCFLAMWSNLETEKILINAVTWGRAKEAIHSYGENSQFS